MNLRPVFKNAFDAVRKAKGITDSLIFERFDKTDGYATMYELTEGWKISDMASYTSRGNEAGSVTIKFVAPEGMPENVIETTKTVRIGDVRYFFGRKHRPFGDLKPYWIFQVSPNRSDVQ